MQGKYAKKITGFSLVELLVVVAILGILTATALPAYENYIIKSRIAEAHRYALALTTEADAFYLDNGRFPGNTPAERAIVSIGDHDTIRGYSFWSNALERSGMPAGQIGTIQIYFHAGLYPGASNAVRLSYDFIPDAFGKGEWKCVQHFVASLRMDEKYRPKQCENEMRFG